MPDSFSHKLFAVGALAILGVAVLGERPGTDPVEVAPGKAHKLTLESAAPQGRMLSGDETVIERDGSGQFHLQARVNGERAEFLVDTGADVVALTLSDAERLGIVVAPGDFQPILQTASGVGKGALVRLDRLAIGKEEFRDVEAVVVEGLPVNLLGQSVLRRFGKVELEGDRMVIAHR